MERFDIGALAVEMEAQCGICRAAAATLIDMNGTAVCEPCLRRIDADPRQKRRVMFAMADASYW
jgi:hypothetical protein